MSIPQTRRTRRKLTGDRQHSRNTLEFDCLAAVMAVSLCLRLFEQDMHAIFTHPA